MCLEYEYNEIPIIHFILQRFNNIWNTNIIVNNINYHKKYIICLEYTCNKIHDKLYCVFVYLTHIVIRSAILLIILIVFVNPVMCLE